MSVLTLPAAKEYLNITQPTWDVELQDTINAAESVIAERCGPLTSTAFTERVKGGGMGLVLMNTPVVSLTSVTPVGGTAYDLTLLDLDKSSGVIEWGSGIRFATGRYDVAYMAGRTTVPSDLLRAIKELVRHMWETQRPPTARPGSRAGDSVANTIPGAAYVLPFRVEQLMVPHIQIGN